MVKFYRIIAFSQLGVMSLAYPYFGHYLGKTSDLVFKTEADKAIDMDDGTTEVGSEKLSLSCTLYGELNNQPEIREIWLIPVTDNYLDICPEILRIYVSHGDYKLEAKSGEFNKILFSISQSSPVRTPQYDYLYYWDMGDKHIILGQLGGDAWWQNEDVCISDQEPLAFISTGDLIIKGAYALVNLASESELTLTVAEETLWGDYPSALCGLKLINSEL